ncbi:MAG: hypothetical protein WC829_09830 [Hyphomicrobium sp.]|jgi:hypothetical protein
MKIIDPIAIPESAYEWNVSWLVNNSERGFVPELAPAAWDAATLYSALVYPAYGYTWRPDRVSVAAGYGLLWVYESTQANNIGNIPGASSAWHYVGPTYQEYDATAVYALGERAQDSTTHKAYESLVEGQTGTTTTSPPVWGGGGSSTVPTAPTAPPVVTVTNSTLLDPTKWLPIGTTNRYAMFDLDNTTKTYSNNEIFVMFRNYGASAVALYGLNGTGLKVDVYDDISFISANIAWTSGDISLETSAVTDVDEWLTVPPQWVDKHAIVSIPPVFGWISIRITGAGTVSCGSVVIGDPVDVGGTQYGPALSLIDYGKKEIDQWGNYTYIPGTYSARLRVSTFFDNVDLDAVTAAMINFRGKPCAYLATDLTAYRALNVLGVYKDFSIDVRYVNNSLTSLEIEGLST